VAGIETQSYPASGGRSGGGMLVSFPASFAAQSQFLPIIEAQGVHILSKVRIVQMLGSSETACIFHIVITPLEHAHGKSIVSACLKAIQVREQNEN